MAISDINTFFTCKKYTGGTQMEFLLHKILLKFGFRPCCIDMKLAQAVTFAPDNIQFIFFGCLTHIDDSSRQSSPGLLFPVRYAELGVRHLALRVLVNV